MATVNICEAKTQLARLVDQAAAGETIIIAKAGRPVAKLTRLDAAAEPNRIGFLAGQAIPDDFDAMGRAEIAELFEPS